MSSNLYYETPSSEVTYTKNPGRCISFQRLIDGKPCFRENNGVEKKRKTLIFHDKNLIWGDLRQLLRVTLRLKALEKEGFEIYSYHKNKIVKGFKFEFYKKLQDGNKNIGVESDEDVEMTKVIYGLKFQNLEASEKDIVVA